MVRSRVLRELEFDLRPEMTQSQSTSQESANILERVLNFLLNVGLKNRVNWGKKPTHMMISADLRSH